MDPAQKQRLIAKLNITKETIRKQEEGLDIDLPNPYSTKRELKDSIRLKRIQQKEKEQEKEKKRLERLSHDPETFERLSTKQHFGTYQLDMVRMFRKIIQEVDEGKLIQLLFLLFFVSFFSFQRYCCSCGFQSIF